ncbi:MAG: phosphatase PAP2 family protein [Acidobacteriota bacterium]|nr:phosphatase PAP2 family protein [Acidobacteriota bacterium]
MLKTTTNISCSLCLCLFATQAIPLAEGPPVDDVTAGGSPSVPSGVPDSKGLTDQNVDPAIPLFPGRDEQPWIDVPDPDRVARPGSEPYWRTNLFRRVLDDQAFLVTTWWPAETRELEFTLPMLVAVAGARSSVTHGADLTVSRSIEEWTGDGRRDAAVAFSRLGDGKTALVVIGGGYLISRWAGNDRMSRATSLSAEALLNAGIYSSVLKKLARRTRPAHGGTGEFFALRPENGQSASSFPSGHATGAFAVAAVFVAEYRDRRWVPWLAYGTAGLISLSRVGLGRHFPSDVLAGAILGRSIGRMVVERGGIGHREDPYSRFEPVFDVETGGVGLAYRRSW